MDFIKDKQKAIELLNELINNCGCGKEIAKDIDNTMLDFVQNIFESSECGDRYHAGLVWTLRNVRNLFLELETCKN